MPQPGASRLEPGQSKVRRVAAVSIAALCLSAVGLASALDGLVVQMQGISGPGWETGPISVTLDLGEADVLTFTAAASALRLPAPLHDARSAKVRCPRAQLVAGRWQCKDASVRIEFEDRTALRFQASLGVNPVNGALRLRARNQPFAGGVISIVFSSQAGVLDIDASFSKLSLIRLQQLAALLGVGLPVTASAGQVAGTVRIEESNGTRAATVSLQLDGGAFADETGAHAGDELQFRTRLSARMKPGSGEGRGVWHFDASASLDAGVVYLAPVLLEVAAAETAPAAIPSAPVSLSVRGQWAADGRVRIARLAFRDADVLQFEASMQLATVPQLSVQQFSIDIPEQPVAALYARYLQPFAGAGPAANLRMEGAAAAHVEWSRSAHGAASVMSSMHIKGVNVGDSQGQFAILDLDGDLFWRSAEGPDQAPASSPSRLQWSSAQVSALEFGAGAMNLRLSGREVELLAPLQVDLLDGAVRVERLHGRAMGTTRQHLEMQLSVLPISLQRLSDRLAWLPLSGSISGRIPKLILGADALRIDGDVHLDLFDGKARLADVRIMHPFSAVSRLHADLFVEGIDLGVLSRAFSFGQIEGRLDGEVRDLILESWQPVAFDAVFSTPPGDTSRHRISQRAVENLASLGGARAVLSSTFLRFFEEFSYARLGLRCRLWRGICEMGGVAPAASGYYIVEGGGMPPRVDVVGFNRRVDWRTLLDRLQAVTGSPGPIIR